jgi:hypothetical protein
MEVSEALAILGVSAPCTWEDVRSAYRSELLSHHPDVADGDQAGERTEAIVAAFRSLRNLTGDGARPLPAFSAVDDAVSPMVLYARPGDVFARLCQAADQIGHISYADREENVLQVTIEHPEWAPSQLTAELTASGEITTALFSLEPLGVGEAPPIAEVVERLSQRLRAPAALD